MNRNQISNYSGIQKRVQDQMAKIFIGPVYKALLKQISSFTSDAKNHGLQYARSRLSMEIMNPAMASTIQDLHVKAGLWAAQKTRNQITGNTVKRLVKKYEEIGIAIPTGQAGIEYKRGGFGFNERMTTDIIEYFRIHLLEKAVLPISQTTKDRIETVLKQGITEGWGVDRIVQEIESVEFREMTRRRAETIVRTETVRASNYGALAAAHDSDFEQEKVWIAVNDNRTRRTHKHGTGVDGEQRDLLKPFSNGLMFPGDPNGAGSETINCRCAIAFEAKRDADGRLIPKKKPAIVRNLLVDVIGNIYRRIALYLNF
jgi:hypothetical protein